MPEHTQGDLGGTMRLGKRATLFNTENSVMRKLYGSQVGGFCVFDSSFLCTLRHELSLEKLQQLYFDVARKGLYGV